MMARLSFWIAIACTAAFPVQAQFLPSAELVGKAVEAHSLMLKARTNVRAAEADARRLRLGDQEYVVGASYGSRDVNQSGRFNEWETSVSRPIRLPGKGEVDERLAALGEEVQRAGLADVRHQVEILLLEQWTAWLEAEKLAVIDKKEVGLWEQERTAMEARVSARDAAQLDLDMVNTNLIRVQGTAVMSAGRAQEARISLKHQFPDLVLPEQLSSVDLPKSPNLPIRRCDSSRRKRVGLTKWRCEKARTNGPIQPWGCGFSAIAAMRNAGWG